MKNKLEEKERKQKGEIGIIIFKNTKMKKDVSMKTKLEEKERKQKGEIGITIKMTKSWTMKV